MTTYHKLPEAKVCDSLPRSCQKLRGAWQTLRVKIHGMTSCRSDAELRANRCYCLIVLSPGKHLQVGRALKKLAARRRAARGLALQPQRPGHTPRQPARARRARQVRAPSKLRLRVSLACRVHTDSRRMHAPTWPRAAAARCGATQTQAPGPLCLQGAHRTVSRQEAMVHMRTKSAQSDARMISVIMTPQRASEQRLC